MGTARFYEPWIGEHYGAPRSGMVPASVRLLILGESAYGDKWVRRPSYPRDLVQWRVFENNHPRDGFLFGLTKCFGDIQRDSDEARALWLDLAFWEYVQEPLPSDSREPSKSQFRGGDVAFEDLVADLRPSHVWVVSKRLWRNMTEDDATWVGETSPTGKTVAGASSFGCYRYDRGFGSFLAWGTYHPAARKGRFKSEEIRPCLSAFLGWDATPT